ncbi:MAG: DASS family sodium-coupled anion symporter [Gemmatimonadota bacterium]
MTWDVERPAGRRRARIGLVLGAAACLAVLVAPAPEGLSLPAWRTAGVALLMAVWWVTEAIPIPATGLVPLVVIPLLGIGSIDEAARPFANPIIFLLLGGFLLALSMERWGLPRRIALRTIGALGHRPSAVMAGFMIASAFLSMWVSNTATAMMMLPIGLSVLELTKRDTAPDEKSPARERQSANFATGLMLAIAYSCSIGGLGTIVGTPPNAFAVAFLRNNYGIDIAFAQWMAFALPVVATGLIVTYLVLTRVSFPMGDLRIPGGREFIHGQLAELGPFSTPEKRVSLVFALTALLWVSRPLLADLLPGISDPGIAVGAGLLLFMLPSGNGRGERLLSWRWAERLPWGTLLLFGGGLSLASAFQRTGLTTWVGSGMEGFGGWPSILVVMAITTVMILLTELTSNTATSAAFLPVVGAVAIGIGQNPLLLTVPAALAASCAFMLPVATGPNIVVYGSGAITIPQMVRAGALLNVAFVALITLATLLFMSLVFGPGTAVS